jgi:3-hydroxyisobutyrate dehydrogenase-like beta-hydroxyacid dehydrogenase
METGKLSVGFLGFGEAGYYFAKDLTQAGLSGIVAYSPSGAKAAPGDPIRTRATEAGVELMRSPRALCKRARLIIALVPGRAALKSLRSVRAHLTPEHIYVDASTAAVKAMEQAGQMLEGKSGFVDAAVMGTVSTNGIKGAHRRERSARGSVPRADGAVWNEHTGHR